MDFLQAYLMAARQNDLYRQVTAYEPVDAAHVKIDGKIYLLLAANNYLGLTHHPDVRQAAIQAIKSYGTGAGGARLTTGTHPDYLALEAALAAFKGTEAAVVFNTGYMANVGTISAIAGENDVIFSDELNHASIIDGCRLTKARKVMFRHSDMEHLARCLAETACCGRRLIVVDGVFSMDGDIAPLREIVRLAKKYDALTMVDDAHATGVLGYGRGTAAHLGLEGQVDIQMGTLSKALGAEGGYIAGSRRLIDYLVNKARSFIFSTALAPAVIAAALAALRLIAARPELIERLNENSSFMRNGLAAAGLKVSGGITPILPVVVGGAGTAVRLAEELRQSGLIVTAIRPPTVPEGESRLRITVSAAHDQAELAMAIEKISTAFNKVKRGKK